MGLVGARLGFQPQKGDLDNPIISTQPLNPTLEFAISHHARRRPIAGATGITSRPASRIWIASQVREPLQDPNWQHAGIIDKICGAFRLSSSGRVRVNIPCT